MRHLASRAALLALPVVLASCGSPTIVTPEPVLELTEARPEHLEGRYLRAGTGVRFDSLQLGGYRLLAIEALDGRELLKMEATGTRVATYVLGGRLTVIGDELVPGQGIDEAHATIAGDLGAFTALADTPEYRQLPWLSHALAARGLTGWDHPAALPLHDFGLAAAKLHAVDVPTGDLPESTRRPNSSCQDLRSNPHHDKCFGMCGPGCSCWHWVCGDCCSHAGCRHHDTHCRNCDFSHPIDCLHCSTFHIPGGCAP